MEANVLPGELSISIGGASGAGSTQFGSFGSNSGANPARAFGVSTNQIQHDALVFDIENIVVTDADGDGRGFRLTAEPRNLIHEDYNGGGGIIRRRRSTLRVGTIDGFMEPSDLQNTQIVNPNLLVYQSGDGVVLSVDYMVRYTIPRFARTGDYEGTVSFSVVAE